ncbi:hypothetical protein A3Q56_06944 [Intoshia linei]|uniref:Uncharacterized protein n=1 Tax=Intoshia linei TaxID=1819745 RepID=A0A177AVV5_9BILA|nr:hypothetical protein A3Q56_06944 [Intoshia linei]
MLKRKIFKDEIITSSSDSECGQNEENEPAKIEDDFETIQEKRIRLAKKYLDRIKAEELEKSLEKEDQLNLISNRLQHDALLNENKQKRPISHLISFKKNEIDRLPSKQMTITSFWFSKDCKYLIYATKKNVLIKHLLKSKYEEIDSINVRKLLTCKHQSCVLSMDVDDTLSLLVTGDKNGVMCVWNFENLSLKHNFSRAHIGGVYVRFNAVMEKSEIDIISVIEQNRLTKSFKDVTYFDQLNMLLEVWNSMDEKFNSLKCLAKAIFSSTYSCESLFSTLNNVKNHKRNRLHDETSLACNLKFQNGTFDLYSGSFSGQIKIWNLENAMTYVETLYGHTLSVTGLDTFPNSTQKLISCGQDKTLRLWKISDETHFIFRQPFGSVECIAIIDETHFVTGLDCNTICLWVSNKKKPIHTLRSAHGPEKDLWIVSITALYKSDFIVSGSGNGKIIGWKCSDAYSSIKPLFNFDTFGCVNNLSLNSDGFTLFASIGREHKYGRWALNEKAKNQILIIRLNN